MPFEKGQSGNPGGRPKVSMEVKELARQHGPAAILKLVEHLEGEDGRLAQTAAIALLDRGYGKPAQTTVLEGSEERPLVMKEARFVSPTTD